MAQLLLVPLPSPGSVAVRFRINDRLVDCMPAPLCGVPVYDLPYRSCPCTSRVLISCRTLFLLFSPKDVLFLLNCLMFEERLVFASSDMSLLTPIMEVWPSQEG